ncbi:MAG: hypothetical protein WA191_15860 [Telluria sp.]
MSEDNDLNEYGNHQGSFSQGVGGWAEYSVYMTKSSDTIRHDVTVPPGKIIPIIFLPGVMGSNLRMSKARQERLDRSDNRAWRPDDMMSKSGKAGVASGFGLGGWFKEATPAQRQLVFDPNETEVEYYHYTESKGRFDPEGKETLAADARHQNVPDSLPPIPPLMGRRPTLVDLEVQRTAARRKFEAPAQIARWRGWSEVLFAGAYGDMLKITEEFLNNIVVKGKVHPFWQLHPTNDKGQPMLAPQHGALSQLLLKEPQAFGASSGAAISEKDLLKIAPCWYPVHAMGYNFLRSNGDSAGTIAERIRGLVKGYKHRGFRCDEVIIVTHSMGGLLARALIHPSYGNLLSDANVKVLGIYHSAMPTIGAACAYKRMRFGFQENWGPINRIEAKVIAIDGEHATAILANAPAPLELMPASAYGRDWLKVIDAVGQPLWSWPRGEQSALDSIYLQPEKAWWRLLKPLWVNPGNVTTKDGGGLENVQRRIRRATKFLNSIENTFHPTQSYASYSESPAHLSYGEVVFKVIDCVGASIADVSRLSVQSPPESWVLLTDDAKGKLTVRAGQSVLTLKLQPASAAGDETVPSIRSAQHAAGVLFKHGKEKSNGYEHQDSYSDPQVLVSMLYSIVQIAKTAKWD